MDNNLSILIVDDELSVRDSLSNWFIEDGYTVDTAEDAKVALKKIEAFNFHIILVDIKLPGMDGLELNRRIKSINDEAVVIIMTAFASVDSAVQALKDGAYDYVCKPFDPDAITHIIRNASKTIHLSKENITLQDRIKSLVNVEDIIGESEGILNVLEQVRVVAETDSTVIINGDSGTGKELIAKAIHMNSSRRFFPMVTVHCGAIAENLMESELFGHERGAFTGAQYARKGKFEMADGATLFLDEISTISMKMQIELLRVLETKTFTRVGGNREFKSDFRVICATNRDLQAMVNAGEFREDLFYRLNVFSITIPPLRERTEDIKPLTEHFVKFYAEQMNKETKHIGRRAAKALKNYDFPGNVRELENLIERAIVIGTGDTVQLKDLPLDHVAAKPTWESIQEMEHHHIQGILEKYDWNISRSAKALGVDRVTLYSKIKKYKIEKSK
ncbi:MAG: sigma-54-dependent Fis family transcriptional regulator [FCB group bacterium]|nr:sigma-54-dependent Fis family transcriptional regulator [FCB group bacterium]MBL7027834.1 sigma-54-dependent Fis family transcriptional regulator [Candidatus Neomarinimicrobiota bacterium]MBL7120915.1 sigma-54-dependent Fis family transcriptional regulator [Candidatus Neomarinimicrobiota bacterium]